MTYFTQRDLAKELGVSSGVVREWERSGAISPAISKGEGAGRIVLYDLEALTRARSLLVKVVAPAPPSAPAEKRPIVNVHMEPVVELLSTVARDIALGQAVNQTQHAELMASLRTVTEELRLLRACWEKPGSV